jgi:hypothetical protein
MRSCRAQQSEDSPLGRQEAFSRKVTKVIFCGTTRRPGASMNDRRGRLALTELIDRRCLALAALKNYSRGNGYQALNC